MKTGFICASGYNVVASATRNGRRLIAVVLGAWSGAVRAQKAAQLLERGFNNGGLSWLTPSLGTVDALAPVDAQPPNLREEMCGGHRRKPPSEENEEEPEEAYQCQRRQESGQWPQAFMLSSAEAGKRQIRARTARRKPPHPLWFSRGPATVRTRSGRRQAPPRKRKRRRPPRLKARPKVAKPAR